LAADDQGTVRLHVDDERPLVGGGLLALAGLLGKVDRRPQHLRELRAEHEEDDELHHHVDHRGQIEVIERGARPALGEPHAGATPPDGAGPPTGPIGRGAGAGPGTGAGPWRGGSGRPGATPWAAGAASTCEASSSTSSATSPEMRS